MVVCRGARNVPRLSGRIPRAPEMSPLVLTTLRRSRGSASAPCRRTGAGEWDSHDRLAHPERAMVSTTYKQHTCAGSSAHPVSGSNVSHPLCRHFARELGVSRSSCPLVFVFKETSGRPTVRSQRKYSRWALHVSLAVDRPHLQHGRRLGMGDVLGWKMQLCGSVGHMQETARGVKVVCCGSASCLGGYAMVVQRSSRKALQTRRARGPSAGVHSVWKSARVRDELPRHE